MASSSALVCSDWVPPNTAAIASMVVRTTLLYGSCSVSDQPEVWLWVRSIMDFWLFGSNCFMRRHHNMRGAHLGDLEVEVHAHPPRRRTGGRRRCPRPCPT